MSPGVGAGAAVCGVRPAADAQGLVGGAGRRYGAQVSSVECFVCGMGGGRSPPPPPDLPSPAPTRSDDDP